MTATTDKPQLLVKTKDIFFSDKVLTDFVLHKEGKSYIACRFPLDGKVVEFRVSKITPKKIGQFATIWKRNSNGITQPFDATDELDFLIIASQAETKFGVFVFPKLALLEHKIISSNNVGGKRGIRVYPVWNLTKNQQSIKTQAWQSQYFTQQ